MKKLIAFVNRSPTLGIKENPTLVRVAQAISFQLTHHLSPAWGMTGWEAEFFADETKVPAGSIVFAYADDDPTPGALAYHDEAYGLPYGRILVPVILSNGGKMVDGPDSVSSAASHEACETACDPNVDRWVMRPDGSALTALEACDAVQGDSYPIKARGFAVACSNFLRPEWFDGEASGKFDWLGSCSAPFERRPGGYTIELGPDFNVTNAFDAKVSEATRKYKERALSRTSRRAAKRAA